MGLVRQSGIIGGARRTRRTGALWLAAMIALGSCTTSGATKPETGLHPDDSARLTAEVETKELRDDRSARLSPRSITGTAPGRMGEFVQTGTDSFYNPIEAQIAPPPEASEAEGVLVNFVDAEIADVIQSVLGEIMRVSYSIDPAVTGKLTLRSRNRVSQETLLTMLEDELNARGFGIARRGAVYRVAPRDKLKGSPPVAALSGGMSAPGEGVEIIPLDYIGAADLETVLRPLAPQDTAISIDRARNSISITGPRPERERLKELISVFDVDWMAGMSFAVVPVNAPDPEALANDVQNVIAYEDSPLADLIRLVPIKRLSAIVVISQRAAYLTRARKWISQLDPKGTASGRRLYTYEALHVPAAHLAKLLAQLVGGVAEVSPGATRSSSASLVPGANATEIASDDFRAGASSTGSGGGTDSGPMEDRTRIITDDINDTLLIVATPQEYDLIAEAITKLDIEPLQVLIEATIAEISLKDELRYGLQWFFAEGNHQLSLSQVDSGAAAQVFPGFSYLLSDGADTQVVLNALDSVTDVSIVSSPQIFVRDNGTATLQVGDQVPIATQEIVSTDATNPPVRNTIEYRDAGVLLTVTPRINSQGYVQLEIEQEVSTVVNTTTSGIDSPTIQTRRFKSSVTVRSGQTVALGGLIRDDATKGSNGLPVLSRMPFIGPLFGEKRDLSEKTELLALIRPRVVANTSQADQLTEEVRQRFGRVSPLASEPSGER